MYYLMWRVMTGWHEVVEISCLPVGHTTFCRLVLQPSEEKVPQDED